MSVRPLSVDEAVRLVREAPRVVIGGAPAAESAVHLDLSGLTGTLEINPENLSATFLAGTTIAEVDAALAPHGLWWPVDGGPVRTLGAVLSTAGPFPGRTGYGYVRDWVLGLEALLAGGEQMRLGGQTVKNVAGYDLTRLMVGSRGTLGAIASATLRLRPRPERQATVVLPRERWAEAADLAAACEWDGERLLVRVDGRESQVVRRLGNLGCGPAGDQAGALEAEGARDAWSRWHARAAGGRYIRRDSPDWSSPGAPVLGLWQTDEPVRYSPLAMQIRDAIAPGRCFNPTL